MSTNNKSEKNALQIKNQELLQIPNDKLDEYNEQRSDIRRHRFYPEVQRIKKQGLLADKCSIQSALAIVDVCMAIGLHPIPTLVSKGIVPFNSSTGTQFIIDGKTMMALIHKAKYEVVRVKDFEPVKRKVPKKGGGVMEQEDFVTEYKFKRPNDEEWFYESFYYTEAASQDLLKKEVWKKFPRIMMKWRVISLAARQLVPHLLLGMYLGEELGMDVNPDEGYTDAVLEDV